MLNYFGNFSTKIKIKKFLVFMNFSRTSCIHKYKCDYILKHTCSKKFNFINTRRIYISTYTHINRLINISSSSASWYFSGSYSLHSTETKFSFWTSTKYGAEWAWRYTNGMAAVSADWFMADWWKSVKFGAMTANQRNNALRRMCAKISQTQ